MEHQDNKTALEKLKNGYYISRATPSLLYLVEGENLFMHPASGIPKNLKNNPILNGSVKYGNFGELHPDVAQEIGQTISNVEITLFGGKSKSPGYVWRNGTKITFFSFSNAVDVLEWKNEEEIDRYKILGDAVDKLPHPYKEQPTNQGTILWISGPPGSGKSTSGLLLARNSGHVYYEADCFFWQSNPYISTDVEEPSNTMFTQKHLKNVPQQRIDAATDGLNHFLSMGDANGYSFEKMCKFYKAIADDVIKEHKRIGGDFVVAHAVPTRKSRDYIRTLFGENLTFVVLYMSKEDEINRIKTRHGEGEAADSVVAMLTNLYDLYEPATKDEPNSINVIVTKDMSREDVVKEILKCLEK